MERDRPENLAPEAWKTGHPDYDAALSRRTESFKTLSWAYDTLMDPEKRKAYDTGA